MKIQKIDYLENKKSFLDKIKNIFHSFWRAMIGEKPKFDKKAVDTSFKNQRPGSKSVYGFPILILKGIMMC